MSDQDVNKRSVAIVNRYEYKPSPRMQKFVAELFNTGTQEEASERAGISRINFYKLLRKNAKFREWYQKEVDSFSNALMGKALNKLDTIISDDSNTGTQVSAIRTVLELVGKIKSTGAVTVDNSVNVTFLELVKKAHDINKFNSVEVKGEVVNG